MQTFSNIHAMAIDMPEVRGHPNRIPFEGVLARLDEPSDSSPSGARGHKILVTSAAAKEGLPSLLGMSVNFKMGWDGHDAQRKCGVISSAQIDDKNLVVGGFLYGLDYPTLRIDIEQCGDTLGMSYELNDAHVDDMRERVWRITKLTFTGASILLREKAAYKKTSFKITL